VVSNRVMLMRSAFAAGWLVSAAGATTATFQVLLDLDGNPGTGCPVSTARGSLAGVGQILVTTAARAMHRWPATWCGVVRQSLSVDRQVGKDRTPGQEQLCAAVHRTT
jgi:hypothetical protein